MTLQRHFAGTPNPGLEFLFWSPLAACGLTLAGLGLEAVRVPGSRRLAFGLQWVGVLGLALRSGWTFYNWDGYFYFPAAALLAMSLWRARRIEACGPAAP